MSVVEIDAFFDEFLDRNVAFDVSDTVSLQIAHISHRNIQKPQNNVKAFHIDSHSIINPHCCDRDAEQSSYSEVQKCKDNCGFLGRFVAIEDGIDRKIII